MTTERYVVLGLAQVRSAWFRDLSRWSNSASLPVEFTKAMSVEEVRVRLRSGRAFSALLIDDGMPGFDRDLVELSREAGAAVIVVDHGRRSSDWASLGVSGVLTPGFGRGELMSALTEVAVPVARGDPVDRPTTPGVERRGGFRAQLVAVTGAGGTGRSTVAIGIAQALGSDARRAGMVCLADLALHADQAMLHGSPDVVPGLVELVEAHRSGSPTIDTVRGLTWHVEQRGYHLLLGLRRHRDWTALRPRALAVALDGLRRSFRIVVADVDDDLEGEQSTGSLDVEERNALARTTLQQSDVVVIVGAPGMKGLHSLLRVTRDVLEHGVPGGRVVPVVNRSPRSPRARAEITRAFGELLSASFGDAGVPSPVHLGMRHLDGILRDGDRLPSTWVAPLGGPVAALLEREGTQTEQLTSVVPVPVAPGSLGTWADTVDGDAS